MLRSGPATVELLRPVGPEIPSDERVLEVLDLCLQVGEVLLSSGEAAADTSATMARLADSLRSGHGRHRHHLHLDQPSAAIEEKVRGGP